MRFPFGARGLLAAAAVAGAAIYWRASAQRRAHDLVTAVDEAIAEGRLAAERLGTGPPPGADQFDER